MVGKQNNDWQHVSDPRVVLYRVKNHTTKRKLRLLACAACRRVWFMLTDERSRRAVEAAELYADDKITFPVTQDITLNALHAATTLTQTKGSGWNAANLAATTLNKDAWAAAVAAATTGADAEMMRDIFTAPEQALDEQLLRWHNGQILNMARQIYETYDFKSMPVLGDMLEEAGCVDTSILEHCRAATIHSRGCWVVDWLLKKG